MQSSAFERGFRAEFKRLSPQITEANYLMVTHIQQLASSVYYGFINKCE